MRIIEIVSVVIATLLFQYSIEINIYTPPPEETRRRRGAFNILLKST